MQLGADLPRVGGKGFTILKQKAPDLGEDTPSVGGKMKAWRVRPMNRYISRLQLILSRTYIHYVLVELTSLHMIFIVRL